MLKKILTVMLLSLAICGTASADTTEFDITSRFVKNADFENGKTDWTCSSGVSTENNGTFTAGTHLQTWKEDTKNKWTGKVTTTAPANVGTQSIKQTITLPKGNYIFKAQVISEHIKSTLYVKVGNGNEITLNLEDDTDKSFESINFAVTDASSSVEIGYRTSGEASSSYQSGQGHNAWFAIDNVKIILVIDKNAETDLTAVLLNNPNFDNGTDGWTCSDGVGPHTSNDFTGQFLEKWGPSPAAVGSVSIKQNVTLPKGVYRFTAQVAARNMVADLYAKVSSDKTMEDCSNAVQDFHSVIFQVNNENTTVEMGYETDGTASSLWQEGWDGWFAIDNVTLEYLTEELDYSQIAATYNTYKAKADRLDDAGQAAFASATADIKTDIDNNNLDYYKFMSYPAAIAAAYRNAVLAQTTDNVDMTDGIVNPGFEEGKTGWTCSEGVGEQNNGNFTMNYLEKWTNDPNAMGAQSISQTLTLHQGAYTLGAQVAADNLIANMYVLVNGTKHTTDCTNANKVNKELSFGVTADNTTVTIGYETEGNVSSQWQNGWGIWFAIDNVSLLFKGDSYDMKYHTQQTSYASLMTQNLPLLTDTHPVYTALKALVEETVSITSQAVYENKIAALEAAYQRALKYNQARADLNTAQAVAATTNIAYMGELNTLEGYYTAGTFEANNIYLPLDLGTRTWGMIPTLLLTGWNYADNGYYINTWSVEGETDGSGFTAPFFEYFNGDNALAAKTITATVTGKTPGAWYKVTADARVRTATGNIPSGITLTVGGVGETDVCNGAPVATPNMYLDTFTAYGQADAEGKVTVSLNVKNGTNVNWLSFKNVNIADATHATVNYTLGAEYGTIILPFDAALPSGMTAYSCEAENNGELTLTPAASLKANTPYIISGAAGNYTFNGVAGNKLNSYTSGWLTGVFSDTQAPVGSYVLQNNNDVLGFYLVVNGKQPTVGANHAYLNIPAEVTIVPSSSEIRRLFALSGATGINKLTIDKSAIDNRSYNLQGQKVADGYKGIVIINGKKIVK